MLGVSDDPFSHSSSETNSDSLESSRRVADTSLSNVLNPLVMPGTCKGKATKLLFSKCW